MSIRMKPGLRVKIILLGVVLVAGTASYSRYLSPNQAYNSGNIVKSAVSDSIETEPQIGRAAPNFSLMQLNGKAWALSAQHGHPFILVFFCGCSRCHVAAKTIGILQREGKLRTTVSVIALPPSLARNFQKQTELRGVVLCDPAERVAENYQSSFCPRFWIINALGQICYRSNTSLDGRNLAEALHALQTKIK